MSNLGDGTSELRISTAANDFSRLYAWLDQVAGDVGLSESLLYKLHVAAEEAVVNIAKHAFPEEQPGEFTVRFTVLADAVELLLEDSGPPFDPVSAPMRDRATNLSDIVPGGLGLALMRHTCPDLRYERRGNLNLLTLPFPRDSV